MRDIPYPPPPAWLELQDIRKRNPAPSVWIVLKQGEDLLASGDEGVGVLREYSGIETVAVPLAQREQANDLDWNDLGGYTAAPYAFHDGRYKPADQFLGRDDQPLGVSLVLREQLNAIVRC